MNRFATPLRTEWLSCLMALLLGRRPRSHRQRLTHVADQLRFLLAVELALLPADRLLAVQGRVEALAGELLTPSIAPS